MNIDGSLSGFLDREILMDGLDRAIDP